MNALHALRFHYNHLLLQIGIKGLQTVKPQIQTEVQSFSHANGNKESFDNSGGINIEARMAAPRDNFDEDADAADWVVDNLKFSIKKPVNFCFSLFTNIS